MTLLVFALFAAACGQNASVDADRSQATPSPPELTPPQTPASPAKRSVTVRPGSLPYLTIREIRPEQLTGRISAPARVEFRAQAVSTAGTLVAGRVAKVHVQIGDHIKAGAPLATLVSGEAAQIRSDFARAQTELARANDRLQRQMEMQRSGVGLEVEKVEAETQFKEARTELERSRDLMQLLGEGVASEVIVRAPMDSIVLRAHVSTGAAVGAGSPLFELGQPSAAWIVADVFEKDLRMVEKGAKALIELASLPDPVQGHVVGESAAIQTELRRGSVFIEVDDPKQHLRPGMYARVAIEAAGPSQIVLPTSAVLIKDGRETIVYVEMTPGRFESRTVQVGQAREGMTPILKGLSGGERVVVGGALLLDGAAALLL